MRHFASPDFWFRYRALPIEVQQLADKCFELMKADPRHPSIHLKHVGEQWSARIGLHYRALGVDDEGAISWFWIGTHAAAGAVGSMVTQLARKAGAYVIGTGRAADRQTVLDFGAKEFVDLGNDALEDVGDVDLVFDVIGGDIGKRSAGLIRAGGTLVSIVGPPKARPADGLAVDFVVESDHAQLSEIVERVRDGRLRTNIGNIATLDDAVAAFNLTERRKGKTIIHRQSPRWSGDGAE